MLEDLFQRYAVKLRHHLQRKTNDPDLSADIAQEAFVRVARQAHVMELENPPSYLFRTANNLLIDYMRQNQSRATDLMAPELFDEVLDVRPGPEQLVQEDEEMSLIREALLAMPPKTRAVFQLCRLQGWSRAETADWLGISQSSVQKHLSRALIDITRVVKDAD